jgi:hypothetical protein
MDTSRHIEWTSPIPFVRRGRCGKNCHSNIWPCLNCSTRRLPCNEKSDNDEQSPGSERHAAESQECEVCGFVMHVNETCQDACGGTMNCCYCFYCDATVLRLRCPQPVCDEVHTTVKNDECTLCLKGHVMVVHEQCFMHGLCRGIAGDTIECYCCRECGEVVHGHEEPSYHYLDDCETDTYSDSYTNENAYLDMDMYLDDCEND